MTRARYYRYAIVVVLALGFIALFANLPLRGEAKRMSFIVGFDEPTMMKGVQVLLVQKNGQVLELGNTDGGGFLEVEVDLLRDKGRVILFCQEGFFCGGFLVNEPDFFEYRERYIELAPLAWQ
jgi:hypothetical protein